MAVTITSEPSAWQTSDNPQNYIFSSDQTGEANFSFKVELKVDGAVIYEDKVFVEVSTLAHFDASTISRYKASGPVLNSALFAESGTTRTIQLVVTENYGEPAVDQLSASSTVTKIFKANVSDKEYIANDYDTDFKGQKWLTDHPTNSMQALRTQEKCLSIIGGGVSSVLTMVFYNSVGIVLHTYNSPAQTFELWQLNLVAKNLTLIAGVPNLSLVTRYTVQVGTSDIVTVTYLDDYSHAPTAMTWVNHYGAFDSFIFQHSHLESGTTKSSNYTRQFGGWESTSYTFDLGNSGPVDYFKNNLQKGKVVTDYLTEQIHTWFIRSLVAKGLGHTLYLIDGTNYPVTLTTKNYNIKLRRWEDLISEVIAFDISYSDNSPVL